MNRSIRSRGRVLGIAVWAAALVWTPAATSAQVDVSVGMLVAPDPGRDATPGGPVLAVSMHVPSFRSLVLEAGWGRTDFTVAGRDFHDDHIMAHLSREWRVGRGPTAMGIRVGLGAYGVLQTVESDPPTGGGDNWFETIVPALVVTHAIAPRRRLVISVSDAILGPVNAILDSGEYSVEHRVRILIGLEL